MASRPAAQRRSDTEPAMEYGAGLRDGGKHEEAGGTVTPRRKAAQESPPIRCPGRVTLNRSVPATVRADWPDYRPPFTSGVARFACCREIQSKTAQNLRMKKYASIRNQSIDPIKKLRNFVLNLVPRWDF
jgi:hypothetical protein